MRSTNNKELFCQPPPLQDFWELLLSRGGSLLSKVSVHITGARRRAQVCRWYPRSLFKTLLLVSEFWPIFFKVIFQTFTEGLAN